MTDSNPTASADESQAVDYGAAERRKTDRVLAAFRWVHPWTPDCLRYVGPYHEAAARLAGRQSGVTTRLSNRFWIGQKTMAG